MHSGERQATRENAFSKLDTSVACADATLPGRPAASATGLQSPPAQCCSTPPRTSSADGDNAQTQAALPHLPPGPRNRWLGLEHIGPLRRDLLDFGLNLAREYGEAAVVRIAGVRIFQFAHPQYVQDVLVNRADDFRKPAFFRRVFGRWIGDGIATAEGPAWARRRRIVQAALQRIPPEVEAEITTRHARRLVLSRIGQRMDISGALQRVAFAVVTEAVFGRAVADQCDWLFEQSDILQFAGVAKMSSFVQLPYFIPTPGNRRIDAATRPFDEALRDALKRWRGPNPPEQTDLVGELLTARDEHGVPLTDREIRDEAITMIFGGKETAGFSLVWTAYLLARYPEVQEKAIAEVRRVLGDREPTAADVARLPYLDLVCKEAMRLYPPAYMMCRQALRSTHVGRYRIRRGSIVLLLTYQIHRDPRWFDDPEDFRPERFEGGIQNLPKFAYFPFGGGRRVCVGGRLAMLESVLSLATILQRCRMQLPADHVPPQLGTDIALHPKGPIDVILEPLAG